MIPATGWKNRAGRLEATASVRVIPITIKTEQFQTNQVAAISYEVKPESGSWELECGEKLSLYRMAPYAQKK